MQKRNERKYLRRAAIVFAAVVAVAAAIVILLLRLGVGENFAQEGSAVVAGAWQNLFGAATYDVTPDEDASDTTFSDATSSFDNSNNSSSGDMGEDFPPVAENTDKDVSSPDHASTHTSDDQTMTQENENNDNVAPGISPTIASATPQSASSSVSLNASSSDSTQSVSAPACAFPSAPSSLSRKIILNEVAWMGSPSSTSESATAAANDEWIELKNISSGDVDLAGWSVMSESGAIKIIFVEGDHIPASGLVLLARGAGGTVSSIAQKIYAGGLPNTGDELVIQDPQCNVSDFLDASSGWPAGNNTTKQTLERAADHESWQTSAPIGGTPGAENSAGVPAVQQSASTQTTGSSGSSGSSSSNLGDSTASSTQDGGDQNASSTAQASSTQTTFCPADHIVIAQIQIAGSSSANDFVKLYNPTAAALDMSGWKLRKKSSSGTDASVKVFGPGSMIGPGAYFTWANSSNGFALSIGADVSSTETLAADNSVALMDASGTIIDEVAWGTGASQYVEGNAFPTDPAADQILERAFDDGVVSDSDDNAADFTLH
jgi:hypothetical protein